MQRLGSIQGRGDVEVKGKVIGAIDYAIDVWQDGAGWKSATGSSPGDVDVLASVFSAGGAVLHLQTGGTANFFVTRLGMGDAELQFSGAIPGY